MDGHWNAGLYNEFTQQGQLSKHRLLRVNLSNVNGTLAPGDESGQAVSAPPTILDGDGGPHFIMSSETPDNAHAFGFEWALSVRGVSNSAGNGPFTVTIWEMIGTSTRNDPAGVLIVPIWAAMTPNAGVLVEQLFHSFDVNATAIRFQIDDGAAVAGNRSVIIAFCEL